MTRCGASQVVCEVCARLQQSYHALNQAHDVAAEVGKHHRGGGAQHRQVSVPLRKTRMPPTQILARDRLPVPASRVSRASHTDAAETLRGEWMHPWSSNPRNAHIARLYSARIPI